MAITYRPATDPDQPEIQRLLLEVGGDVWNLSASEFLVAVDDHELIGCIRIKDLGGEKELGSLGVKSACRNRGIGTELVKRVLEKEPFRPVYLLCFAFREDFYRKFGFITVDPTLLPSQMRAEYARVAEKLKGLNQSIIAMWIEK